MASAEAGRPGQYVKLRKEEKDGDAPAGTDDICPGELNQPVHIPELEVQKCEMCRRAGRCFRRTSTDRRTSPGVPVSSGAPRTARAVGLGYFAPMCCLDIMLRPLRESRGRYLALARLFTLKVASHWLS